VILTTAKPFGVQPPTSSALHAENEWYICDLILTGRTVATPEL
jgi:hypothetical protein